MKDTLSDEILSRIQKAVAAETGIDVGPEAATRLRAALLSSIGSTAPPLKGNPTQEVTVLLTDLRGFTLTSETYSAQTIFEILNRYLTQMCEIANQNGGTIDKFMGDAVMLLFGAPQQRDDDARRAVTCAVQMQIAMDEVNHDLASRGLPMLYMGAGINTGLVAAGMLGSQLHSEYTVIGDDVNVASRIEAFSLRGQVLISETTFDKCRGFVDTDQPMEIHVKGKLKPVRLCEVLGIPSLGLKIPRRDVRKSPRVEAMVRFTYQLIVNKVVQSPKCSGMTLDFSYQGFLSEVEPGLTQYADILIELDLSLISSHKHEIFAKVQSSILEQGRHFAGIEFTSLSPQCEQDIRRFVQLLIQGSPMK